MDSKAKSHTSVLEMVKHALPEETEFHAALARSVNEASLGRTLMLMRCQAGLSQGEMGEKIGCAQGTVSKIEHSPNDGITVGELLAYAKALQLNLSVAFHPSMDAAQAMDFHAREIGRHMTQLAHQDEAIERGVRDHFKKFQNRMMDIISSGCGKLPAHPPAAAKPPPPFEIVSPVNPAAKRQEPTPV